MLRDYQHALIYALRYNRFLLDEVLSGRPQGTPLRSIIPECLKRGEEGRRMLIALREGWQTGRQRHRRIPWQNLSPEQRSEQTCRRRRLAGCCRFVLASRPCLHDPG